MDPLIYLDLDAESLDGRLLFAIPKKGVFSPVLSK